MLNSYFVFGERTFDGAFRKLLDAEPVRPKMKSSMPLRSASTAIAARTCGSLNAKCFDLMLERSPSTSVQGSVTLN